MQSRATLSLLSYSALVHAVPSGTLSGRASSCTFTSTASLAAGRDSCTDIAPDGIAVPAGETLDLTDLADGTSVTFQGTTTFGEGPLVSVSGVNVAVTGAGGHVLDGDGARWWDGQGSNGGKTKPKFFAAHKLNASTITGLYVKNTPVQGFSINQAYGLTLQDITIDNADGDAAGGHNTDAFDVGSSDGVQILGADDDCLAVNSGANVEFRGGSCAGGHGLSIGSVGGRADDAVRNVHISSSRVRDSQNGVRVKTVTAWLSSRTTRTGAPTGAPSTGVPVTGLALRNVTGTVAEGATEVYILCGSGGACSGWTWSDVSVTGGKVSSECSNIPSGASC
ncbi:hypothetical protein Hte_003975 [Hypoxylon texense]